MASLDRFEHGPLQARPSERGICYTQGLHILVSPDGRVGTSKRRRDAWWCAVS